jgi:hypothetical protein
MGEKVYGVNIWLRERHKEAVKCSHVSKAVRSAFRITYRSTKAATARRTPKRRWRSAVRTASIVSDEIDETGRERPEYDMVWMAMMVMTGVEMR